jgi:hypothetical protein
MNQSINDENKSRVNLVSKVPLTTINVTSTRISIDLAKKIKKLTKPMCVELIDISRIIDFKKHPNTTKVLTESALQRIQNIEAQILNIPNKKAVNDQSLVEIERYEIYKKNLQFVSTITQVLRYDRANESLANESFIEDN